MPQRQLQLQKHVSPNNILSTVNSGQRYQQAYATMVKVFYGVRAKSNHVDSGFSVASKGYCNGKLYRAHPDYHGLGTWNDWAMVQWDKEPGDRSAECFDYPHIWLGHEGSPVSQFNFAPAKILGFVELDNGDTMVLIKSCEYTHHQTSVFSSEWHLSRENDSPYYQMVDPETLIHPCLMIPVQPLSNHFIQVWPKDVWGREFNNDH